MPAEDTADGEDSEVVAKPVSDNLVAAADGKPATAEKRGREVSFTLNARSIAKAVGALVVIAALVGVGVLGWAFYRDQQKLAAFDDVKAASEVYVTRMVSVVNAGNAGKYKELVGPLSTGDLRTRLEQETDETQSSTAALQIEATSKIVSSSVQSFDNDTAKTTVMAEVTGRSAQAPNGATNLMIFQLELRKEGGQWLVSAFGGPPGTERSGLVDPNQSLPGEGQSGNGQTGGQPGAPAPTPSATAPAG